MKILAYIVYAIIIFVEAYNLDRLGVTYMMPRWWVLMLGYILVAILGAYVGGEK